MPSSQTPRQDHTTGVDAKFVPVGLPWQVVSVKVLPDYRLWVRFRDGLEGEVQMRDMVHGAHSGVFSELRDLAKFATAHVEYSAVVWDGGLDLAPDAMHSEIMAHGRWVLA